MMTRALLLVGAVLLWTAAAYGQSVYAVDRQQVNVRADATTQSSRIAILKEGEQVVEMRRAGQWMQVRMADGTPGWIHSQLLRARLLVEGEGLRLRSSASSSGTSVTMLFRGQEVSRIGVQGDWTQVQLQDGRKGWLASRYVRAKVDIDLHSERPQDSQDNSPAPRAATEVAAPGTDAPADASGPEDRATVDRPTDPVTILRDPYAEGLQHEAGGDHALALDSFLEVLKNDADHVNALVHAAQAHRKLSEPEAALGKLYRALKLTGGRKDVYLTLGEIYRQQSAPDSAAKYQALFRGDQLSMASDVADTAPEGAPEAAHDSLPDAAIGSPLPRGTVLDDLPSPRSTDDDPGLAFDSVWLPIGLAGLGLLALAGVAWWVLSTSTHRTRKGAALAEDKGFGKVWNEEAQQASSGRASTEEEAELDRQIDAGWRELKDSAAAFKPAPVSAEGVDGVLDQVDGLRQTLEGQDERARIYADIVRLQNMKIEAMTEEIRRLRKK